MHRVHLVIERLDRAGRQRALTDEESRALETALRRSRRLSQPAREYRVWSRSDDDKVAELYNQGKGPLEIAVTMGRSRNTVKSRILHLRQIGRIGYIARHLREGQGNG